MRNANRIIAEIKSQEIMRALLICFILSFAQCQKEDWIDPHDMGLSKPEMPKKIVKSHIELKSKVNESKKLTNVSISDQLIKRHVRRILSALQVKDSTKQAEGIFEISFGQHELASMRSFLSLDDAVSHPEKMRVTHAMEATLDKMLAKVLKVESLDPDLEEFRFVYLVRWFENNFFIVPLVIAFTLLAKWWRGTPMWKIFVSCFFISCGWEWSLMYKKILAKRYEIIERDRDGIPSYCSPNKMSFLQSLLQVFSAPNRKECSRLHEALTIDAYLEVNPALAIVETCSKLFFQPLEQLGEKLGTFIHDVLAANSYLASPGVLIFCFAIFFAIMVILSGYTIRLPFFLGSIEPSNPKRFQELQNNAEEIQELKRLTKQLLEICKAERVSLKAIKSDEASPSEEDSNVLEIRETDVKVEELQSTTTMFSTNDDSKE